ncbi:isopentenyl diphosphate isomerase/L-lactate dehydrogenase-like FMN-dependent dehydrogenase [Ensifer sp. KUDG1]
MQAGAKASFHKSVDGGFRRGTDVIKALALGARFVFVGRPFLYAAVAAGSSGILKAIDILKSEIHQDMALLGAVSLDDIDDGFVVRRDRR